MRALRVVPQDRAEALEHVGTTAGDLRPNVIELAKIVQGALELRRVESAPNPNLATYAFQVGIQSGDIPLGASVSLFMFPILAFAAFFVLRGVNQRTKEIAT